MSALSSRVHVTCTGVALHEHKRSCSKQSPCTSWLQDTTPSETYLRVREEIRAELGDVSKLSTG